MSFHEVHDESPFYEIVFVICLIALTILAAGISVRVVWFLGGIV